MRTDLKHLRYFVVLAEQRHFGRAAEILHMAQPPLSQQIKALESSLGVELFDRSVRPIGLTAAGRALFREARQILAQVERAETITRRAGTVEHGQLRISLTGTATLEFAAPVISLFKERFPHVHLSLQEMSSPQQQQAVEKGEVHIGFVRPPVIQDNLEVALVHQEPFIVALPSHHPLAGADGVRLQALGETPLVVFDSEDAPGFRDLISHLCATAGYRPSSIQEGHQVSTMLCLVASNAGFALVPQSARRIRIEGVTFQTLLDESPFIELYAISSRGKKGPFVGDFLQAVDDCRASKFLRH
ncbi:LysR family transcriptional regulator [Pseudomonas sp. S37]|uniref:LysR substrate-binding domain-containing protein n=1 Tax=Pseudomonas sp. S37 TaxID=2767449 RepID=UPI001913D08B|nr:LysR substrate-binding domain-containing protein [Pseudomonas sp. S37]MBK4992454.1 LysR family transcriptional regulator [Pseudomonas sp. S37]